MCHLEDQTSNLDVVALTDGLGGAAYPDAVENRSVRTTTIANNPHPISQVDLSMQPADGEMVDRDLQFGEPANAQMAG